MKWRVIYQLLMEGGRRGREDDRGREGQGSGRAVSKIRDTRKTLHKENRAARKHAERAAQDSGRCRRAWVVRDK